MWNSDSTWEKKDAGGGTDADLGLEWLEGLGESKPFSRLQLEMAFKKETTIVCNSSMGPGGSPSAVMFCFLNHHLQDNMDLSFFFFLVVFFCFLGRAFQIKPLIS